MDGDSDILHRILGLALDTNAKVEEYGRELARHDVRIGHVEQHVRDIKDDRTHDQRQGVPFRLGHVEDARRQGSTRRAQLRTSLLVGVFTVVLSTGGTAVINLFTR